MTGAELAWSIVSAYMVIAVLAMRPLYGEFRAWKIDSMSEETTSYDYRRTKLYKDPVASYEKNFAWEKKIFAGVASLVWPLAVLIYGTPFLVLPLFRWMGKTQTTSNFEKKLALTAEENRLKELEKKIGELEASDAAWRRGDHA